MTSLRHLAMMTCVVFVFSSVTHANESVSDRAVRYSNLFFPDGAPTDYLDKKISPPLKGTREFLTVLPGTLYRGGVPGGRKPLSAEALQSLCEAGFSLAYYGYTENYKDPGPIECTNKLTGKPNTLRYHAGKILDMNYKLGYLKELADVVNDPSRGPIFVHCWNGYHASGELAAVALRQICDWDGARASEYWKRHAAGFPMISRIRSFIPDPGLRPDRSGQSALCQQGN